MDLLLTLVLLVLRPSDPDRGLHRGPCSSQAFKLHHQLSGVPSLHMAGHGPLSLHDCVSQYLIMNLCLCIIFVFYVYISVHVCIYIDMYSTDSVSLENSNIWANDLILFHSFYSAQEIIAVASELSQIIEYVQRECSWW